MFQDTKFVLLIFLQNIFFHKNRKKRIRTSTVHFKKLYFTVPRPCAMTVCRQIARAKAATDL